MREYMEQSKTLNKQTIPADFRKEDYMELCSCKKMVACFYCDKSPPCNRQILYCDICQSKDNHDHKGIYVSSKCMEIKNKLISFINNTRDSLQQISLIYYNNKLESLIGYCVENEEKQNPQKKAKYNIKKDYDQLSVISYKLCNEQKILIEQAVVEYKILVLLQIEKELKATIEEVEKLAYLSKLSSKFVLENYQSSITDDQNGDISKFTIDNYQEYMNLKLSNIPQLKNAQEPQDNPKFVKDIIGKSNLFFCSKIENQQTQLASNFKKFEQEKIEHIGWQKDQDKQNELKAKQHEEKIAQLKTEIDLLEKSVNEKSEDNSKLVKKFEDDMLYAMDKQVKEMKAFVKAHNGCAD